VCAPRITGAVLSVAALAASQPPFWQAPDTVMYPNPPPGLLA